MDQVVKIEEQSTIGLFVWLIVGSVVIVIGLSLWFYFHTFPAPIESKQETWGQFGDFLGGTVNPIIGFFTIVLLAVSLKQSQTALAQAKAELELTRKAVQDAEQAQRATEAALREQVEIAGHARDMNNTIALHSALIQQQELAYMKVDEWQTAPNSVQYKEALERLDEVKEAGKTINIIMFDEVFRLTDKYITNAEI